MCKQLGYDAGAMTLNGIAINLDFTTGPYIINNVRCNGNEDGLIQCIFSTIGKYDHNSFTTQECEGEEVYVKCKEGISTFKLLMSDEKCCVKKK